MNCDSFRPINRGQGKGKTWKWRESCWGKLKTYWKQWKLIWLDFDLDQFCVDEPFRKFSVVQLSKTESRDRIYIHEIYKCSLHDKWQLHQFFAIAFLPIHFNQKNCNFWLKCISLFGEIVYEQSHFLVYYYWDCCCWHYDNFIVAAILSAYISCSVCCVLSQLFHVFVDVFVVLKILTIFIWSILIECLRSLLFFLLSWMLTS